MSRTLWLVGAAFVFGFTGGCSSSSGGNLTTDSGAPDTSTQDVTTPSNDASMDVGNDQDAMVGMDTSVTPMDTGTDTLPSGVDGGMPSVAPSTLDFGLVNCGSTGVAQTFTIQNPSASSVMWTASLGEGASSPFQLSSASGQVAAGGSFQVTVTPLAVPTSSTTSPNGLGDVVTVTLNSGSTPIVLKETAQGAQLTFIPTSVPFGNVPLASGATTADFDVQNSGNAAANVTLTLGGDPVFSLPSGTTQTLMTMGGGISTSAITFQPSGTASYAGTITMTVGMGDVLCAPIPSPLGLTGTGTNGAVAVSPASILFGNNGFVDCGTTAPTQQVTIQNTGNASLMWTSSLQHGSTYYTLSPTSGTVPANSSVLVTVTPKQIPGTSTTLADGYSDTLTITTNVVGDSPHTVALHQTAHGAIVSRSTGTLSFGNVPDGTVGTLQPTFSNTGNVDATLAFANGNIAFTQPTTLTVGAGTFAPEIVTFSPTAPGSYTDIGTVALAAPAPLCGALPGNLTLSGTGTNPSVTATPNTLNFGYVLCGGTGTLATTTIANNGPATMYTATLLKGAGSPFTVMPSSGMLNANGNTMLTVTPVPIPMYASTSNNAFGDTLQVTTSNGTVDVTLNETALGAVLAYTKASIAFGNIPINTVATSALGVTNSGTMSANVTISASPAVFGISPTSASVTNGTTYPFTASFSPTIVGSYSGAITLGLGPNTTLCAPLPLDVTLTGTGH